jgi:hypothetical protein
MVSSAVQVTKPSGSHVAEDKAVAAQPQMGHRPGIGVKPCRIVGSSLRRIYGFFIKSTL